MVPHGSPPSSIPSVPRSLARWGLALTTSAIGMTGAALVRLASPVAAQRLIRATCALDHRIFRLDVRLHDRSAGVYERPPYVFVHLDQTSLSESFLLPWLAPRPYRIIVNLEYALLPVLGWVNFALGARIVVRQWPAQAKRTISRAIDDLRRGDTYLISIEGRHSPDGALQPYKKGPVVMAIESGATIVPFLTLGARERLPHGEWRMRPGPVDVVLLEPISTKGLTYDDRDALVARLRALAEREIAAWPGR